MRLQQDIPAEERRVSCEARQLRFVVVREHVAECRWVLNHACWARYAAAVIMQVCLLQLLAEVKSTLLHQVTVEYRPTADGA